MSKIHFLAKNWKILFGGTVHTSFIFNISHVGFNCFFFFFSLFTTWSHLWPGFGIGTELHSLFECRTEKKYFTKNAREFGWESYHIYTCWHGIGSKKYSPRQRVQKCFLLIFIFELQVVTLDIRSRENILANVRIPQNWPELKFYSSSRSFKGQISLMPKVWNISC